MVFFARMKRRPDIRTVFYAIVLSGRLQIFSAAGFEFFAGTANAGLFHSRQRDGRIDEIPLPGYFHECRQLVMHCPVSPVSEVGFKFDLGVIFSLHPMREDVQAQPFGFYTPLHQFGGIEECLLCRHGGGDNVIYQMQDVCAVSGAHQHFGCRRQDMAQMRRSAAAGIACA